MMTQLIMEGLVTSAHDISEGGLMTALAEGAMAGSKGFSVSVPSGMAKDIFLFSESQGRVIITVNKENLTKSEALLSKQGVPFVRLGTVSDSVMKIDGIDFGHVRTWETIYRNTLSDILEQ
jgi:phosphoribosylformylglycinamidine synthase